MPIPRTIIQTHKDEKIGAKYRQSWKFFHPGFIYHFFDNDACRYFFETHLPEMLETYDKLPLPVQKADLFRYAYLFLFGGVYSDVDTVCEAPLHTYIDLDVDHLVVGLEMEPSLFKYDIHRYTQQYISPFQVLQWTIASSPKHPAFKTLLHKIRYMVSTMTSDQLSEFSKSDRFTLELTGPMLFSQVIIDYLSAPHKQGITLLKQPYWGFNPWHNKNSEEIEKQIKVRHLFHGSWKPSRVKKT